MFPDPLHTEHLEHMLVEEMKQANVDPRFIYAFEKTGLLVTDFNYEVIPIPDLLAWQDAIEEYEFLQEDEVRTVAESADPYPVGSMTMYGPDRTKTFMIVGSVFLTEQSTDPICKRWLGSSVRSDPQITSEMTEFFLNHGVKSVICLRENVGCVHQEGMDYPFGEDCPFCPYWRGKSSEDPA